MKILLLLCLLVASLGAQAEVVTIQGSSPPIYLGAAVDTKPISGVKVGATFIETDTNNVYKWTGSEQRGTVADWDELYEGVTLGTKIAGERNEDSTTGSDTLATSRECASSGAIDLSTNASTTVYNGPAILCGIVLSVTVGTAAATIDDSATVRYPVPVALPIGPHEGFGTIFETTLVVNPDDSSTGTLYVYFRPLDAGVTWAY